MAVDWNFCPRLQGIQHPLAAILGCGLQIEVRMEAHILFDPLNKRPPQIVIYHGDDCSFHEHQIGIEIGFIHTSLV